MRTANRIDPLRTHDCAPQRRAFLSLCSHRSLLSANKCGIVHCGKFVPSTFVRVRSDFSFGTTRSSEAVQKRQPLGWLRGSEDASLEMRAKIWTELFELFIWTQLPSDPILDRSYDFHCSRCFLEISYRENTIRQNSSHSLLSFQFLVDLRRNCLFSREAQFWRLLFFVCLRNNMLIA